MPLPLQSFTCAPPCGPAFTFSCQQHALPLLTTICWLQYGLNVASASKLPVPPSSTFNQQHSYPIQQASYATQQPSYPSQYYQQAAPIAFPAQQQPSAYHAPQQAQGRSPWLSDDITNALASAYGPFGTTWQSQSGHPGELHGSSNPAAATVTYPGASVLVQPAPSAPMMPVRPEQIGPSFSTMQPQTPAMAPQVTQAQMTQAAQALRRTTYSTKQEASSSQSFMHGTGVFGQQPHSHPAVNVHSGSHNQLSPANVHGAGSAPTTSGYTRPPASAASLDHAAVGQTTAFQSDARQPGLDKDRLFQQHAACRLIEHHAKQATAAADNDRDSRALSGSCQEGGLSSSSAPLPAGLQSTKRITPITAEQQGPANGPAAAVPDKRADLSHGRQGLSMQAAIQATTSAAATAECGHRCRSKATCGHACCKRHLPAALAASINQPAVTASVHSGEGLASGASATRSLPAAPAASSSQHTVTVSVDSQKAKASGAAATRPLPENDWEVMSSDDQPLQTRASKATKGPKEEDLRSKAARELPQVSLSEVQAVSKGLAW